MTAITAGVLMVLLAGAVTPGAASEDPSPRPVEAMSLLDQPLYRPQLEEPFRREQEARLAEARARLARAPDDVEALIWVGRRTAYLGRYREAVAVYTEGLSRHPDEPRLYRHRGHRWITLRELDRAVGDLRRAAELVRGKPDRVEPDGLPNAYDIPTSTLQSNIWYHLGLAHYLQGDFEAARRAYEAALEVSATADMRIATTHWLYMALRRLGSEDAAAALVADVSPQLEILENHEYFQLVLGYSRGRVEAAVDDDPGSVASATYRYGVATWHLVNGRPEAAEAEWRSILSGEVWAAFGFIAAEADLARSAR